MPSVRNDQAASVQGRTARAQTASIRPSIRAATAKAKLIEKRLNDPTTYAKRKPEDITWANTRRIVIARQTAALEEEWLALSEQLDAA